MSIEKIERDLAFIKETMEKATRYENIASGGYLLLGFIALIGVGATHLLLGDEGLAQLDRCTTSDLYPFAALWSGVLVAALIAMGIASRLRARRRGVALWNSLATRMFLSQVPLVFVAGVLTVCLALLGKATLVPGLWLLNYGVITYSFSYFTGRDHQVKSVAFLALGTTALFCPVEWRLWLLGAGFGAVHIAFGFYRMARKTAA